MLTAMASAGLLTLSQSMMIIYGASAGSGWSTYLMARGVSGSSRQLPIMQAIVKVLGIAILLPSLRRRGNIPCAFAQTCHSSR